MGCFGRLHWSSTADVVCLDMSGVDTESFTTALQIGVIVSGCGLRFGSRRSGMSPVSKCRALSTMVAVLGVTHIVVES